MNGTMVIHGPEAFDSGDVARAVERLHPSRIIVSGIMGRTAAEESGIPCEFITVPPSLVLRHLPNTERPYLLNHAKSSESARVFGSIVAGRTGRGLIQVEGTDGTVIAWDGADRTYAGELAARMEYGAEAASSSPPDAAGPTRTIRGCIPGEPVFVNGIIIGTATAPSAVIGVRAGEIIAIDGITLKPHGVEKLMRQGLPDLAAAWCKSGGVRNAGPVATGRCSNRGIITVIDHAGCDLYEHIGEETCGVLAIGDDTTAVCGHICAHRGIPVFGVTDGDADGIISPSYCTGSVVVHVISGRDDDLGREIAAGIPDGHHIWDEWVQDVIDRFEGQVRVVRDLRCA
ncbi:hypothetical protein AZH53_06965 [Methanomicrobiaceae archaeon CYW5]|nr:hypothetical protein [Methanovulcanius yangii]